ncbi:CheR family methyltransferase [Undibacterium sp. RuRC25W]|uniref:CheR family methyltransferase n=1 Tax=Undibacterium sp. RuRC25W TaxID=3413047 RepID=UPI003BF42232
MTANALIPRVVASLKKNEFEWISRFLYERTGISLSDGKQAMVMGRLDKRLRKRGLNNYSDYFNLLGKPGYEDETTVAIDLLTTNETYFFREPKHFEFLKTVVYPQHDKQHKFRIWSAASSSGEEAYTIAMTLAEYFREDGWEILGTDISTQVLERAVRALYPMAAAEKIPTSLLKKYCLKGRDEFEDFFLIDQVLRSKVRFQSLNLIEPLPEIGVLDVIFLRNVMIYFDLETKRKLVQRMIEKLRPGGYFFISHSETLNGLNSSLKMVSPSIYQRVA